MKCSICLDVIDSEECKKFNGKLIYGKTKITSGIKCNHHFHKSCLLNWYYSPKANSDKCPLCRAPIIFKSKSLNNSRYLIRKKKIKNYLLDKRYSYLCHNSSELDYYENSSDYEDENEDENEEENEEDSLFYNIFEQYQVFINSSQNELRNFYNVNDTYTIVDENYFLTNMINTYSDYTYPFLANIDSLRDELNLEMSLQQSLMDTMNLNSLDNTNPIINQQPIEVLPQIIPEQNYTNQNTPEQPIIVPEELQQDDEDDGNIDFDQLYEEDNLFKGISAEITHELENQFLINKHTSYILQMHKHQSRNLNKKFKKQFKSKNKIFSKNKKKIYKLHNNSKRGK